MIADNMQQLVERYLSGAMSAEESSSFLARVGHEQELRRLLDADRLISGAVARDRVATMPGATVPGESLMAALDMSRAVVRPIPSSWLTVKVAAIGAAIGLAGLVAGSFLVGPMLRTSSDATPAVRSDAPTAVESTAATPAVTATPETATSVTATPTDAADEAADQPGTAYRAQRSNRASVSSGAREIAPGTTTAREKPASDPADIDKRTPESLPEFDNENLPLTVELKQNRPK